MPGETNEQFIWRLLLEGVKNPYGAAAIMGNLMAESSLSSLCMTGNKADTYDKCFAYLCDNRKLNREDFAHDGIAFGLAQWVYWSRKQALYDYATKRLDPDHPQAPLREIETQIEFLLEEMPKYKRVWKAVTEAIDIQTPCDMVMLEYEKPAGTSLAAREKRRTYAQMFYKKYAVQEELTLEQKVDILWDEYCK